jgi:hypothetical protein
MLRLVFILGFMVAAFSIASIWHSGTTVAYRYFERTRWSGLWDNPNIFGLLMATGMVLALGGLGTGSRSQVLRKAGGMGAGWAVLALSGCLGVVLLGRGLICSYSRGAWVEVDPILWTGKRRN